MKQGSPIHFAAGVFETITPDCTTHRAKDRALRHIRKAHAAPVHRFDMHAPERAKSDWTAVCAHTVTVARRPPRALQRRLLCRLPTQFLQMFRTFTEILRAHQMADPLLERRDRKLAAAAIFRRLLMTSVPGLNVLRPVRTVCFFLRTSCHRSASTITKEPHLFSPCTCKRKCRDRTLTGSDGDRQDKADFQSAGASRLRCCLHIGF
jgi:hypothetical protein